MRFKRVLNEISAEIVGGKIPSNKVFSQGNIVKLPADSEWRRVLGEILQAIKDHGLESEFQKDMDPLDIANSNDTPQGKILIRSDVGNKYYYDVNKKKLFKA
jgi:hypothetical protein